jgi:sec-independent protein translocase protein TatA
MQELTFRGTLLRVPRILGRETDVFELGPEKLLMLLLICLVIFGGKRIPEIGGSIGKGIREFKRGMSEIGESVREPAPRDPTDVVAEESRREPKRLN